MKDIVGHYGLDLEKIADKTELRVSDTYKNKYGMIGFVKYVNELIYPVIEVPESVLADLSKLDKEDKEYKNRYELFLSSYDIDLNKTNISKKLFENITFEDDNYYSCDIFGDGKKIYPEELEKETNNYFRRTLRQLNIMERGVNFANSENWKDKVVKQRNIFN